MEVSLLTVLCCDELRKESMHPYIFEDDDIQKPERDEDHEAEMQMNNYQFDEIKEDDDADTRLRKIIDAYRY